MRFISDDEVLVVVRSGKLIKVNVKKNETKFCVKGKFDRESVLTFWAKSLDYFAVRTSNHRVKIFNHQFEEIESYKFEEEIRHILHFSKNLFLVLCQKEAFLIDQYSQKKNKIDLIDNPIEIYSGACLEKNNFFLHVKVNEKILEGRIYSLKGELISRIKVPMSLK